MRYAPIAGISLLAFMAGWLSSVSSRATRAENAVKVMASYDYENLNQFAEESRMKVVEFYNRTVELRIRGIQGAELDWLQSSAEKLKTDMTEANNRFREKVALMGNFQVLRDYNNELIPLIQRMCDIGNKLSEFEKQHSK